MQESPLLELPFPNHFRYKYTHNISKQKNIQ